ncbi:MAG TPA: PIG-L family deacetylase [Bryobacteraceae bacterium]|nr:PIG-L family deacetylase [Bryobacteraceae bacterium]
MTGATRNHEENSLGNRILEALTTIPAVWPQSEYGLLQPVARPRADVRPVKALVIVAHPDDESECAGVLYRITHELGGIVDQVFVTNGAAGVQYTTPAETYYRHILYGRRCTRRFLSNIRRREAIQAARILGVRTSHFLKQQDTGFTLDPQDGFDAWDVPRVRRELRRLLRRDRYNLVFTLLPEPNTHGHHQTVAQLTLEAAAEISYDERPAILGVRTAGALEGEEILSYQPRLSSLASTTTQQPLWTFDRRNPIIGASVLDYTIVANWVIAEHKSQGMFQMEFGRKAVEHFWLFDISGRQGRSVWSRLVEQMDNQRPAPTLTPLTARALEGQLK